MYVKDKVCFVTGGASGLGLVHAKKLLENGIKGVTLADIDVTKGEEAVKEISQKYGPNKAIFIKLDVVNKKEFEDALKKTVETFGNLDILINNAGIMNDSIWEKEVDINIKGLVNGTQLAFEEYLPKYKSADSEPTIVNIASTAGLNAVPFMPVYCGTKHAVIAISRSLALSHNYNDKKVRVLTLCPGATATPLIDRMDTKTFAERDIPVFGKIFEQNTVYIQPPEAVGDAMVKILEKSKNGSVWVIDRQQLSEIEVPDHSTMKILQTL